MDGLQKRNAVLRLRAEIERLENRPPLLGEKADDIAPDILLEPPAGLLHEVFTSEHRANGVALGFALGLARRHLSPSRPAVLFVQLAHEGQETGLPYGPGLAQFGLDPAALALARVQTVSEMLWALEEGAGSGALAAVVADIAHHPRALDFTVSRRLNLRAMAQATSIFLVRYGEEREASAAQLRWQVEPEASGRPAFDALAPGRPRWRVRLEKGMAALRGRDVELYLDWTEHGFERVEPRSGAGRVVSRPPLPGASLPVLGDRLPKTA